MAPDPVMFVEIEVQCKKCDHKDKVEVPVSCDINATVEGGSLACGLVGEAKQYLKECEKCGAKEFEVKKQSIKFAGTGN